MTKDGPRLPEGPYKGLMPYAERDAALFFGREAEQEIIAANLQAYRLTLLYGESGVGKSSVLRAGVAHHLRQLSDRNLAARGTRDLVVAVCASWRDDPVATIDEGIRAAVRGDGVAAPGHAGSLLERLRRWTDVLESELLIICDQFEDYFLYHPVDSPGNRFDDEFAQAINAPDLQANVLIAVREDALARLDRFKGRIPRLFENYLRIRPLDRDAARAAIEMPIARFNALQPPGTPPMTIDPDLTLAVLDQVRTGQLSLDSAGAGTKISGLEGADDGRIEAPYLQLVMTRVWREARKENTARLQRDTLDRLGGARRIVRTHLDDVMGALTVAEQRAAARAMRYLVAPSGAKIAHSLADLADYADVPRDQLEAIAQKLSSGDIRILRPVVAPGDHGAPPRYEIFHDVLAPAVLDWRQRTDATRRAQIWQGLEPLHRHGRAASWRLLVGAALLAIPFTVAIADPAAAQAQWVWVSVAALGVLLLVGVCLELLTISWRIAVAARLGFQPAAIVDVLIDERGDVGALVAGTGVYGHLDAEQRRTLLWLRRVRAAARFGGAIALLAGAVAATALGSWGVIEPDTAVSLLVLIASAILIVWMSVTARAKWIFERARRLAKKESQPAGAMASARFWSADIDPFVPDERAAISRPAAARMALSLGVALTTVAAGVAVVFTVLILAWASTRVVSDVFLSWLRAAGTITRLEMRDIGRPYRLPFDRSISPAAAGDAYYALTGAASAPGLKPARPREQRFTTGQTAPPFEKTPGYLDSEAFEGLVARARSGLTGQERAYLDVLAANPAVRDVSLLARAPSVDIVGARLTAPPPRGLFDYPVGNLLEIRYAALAMVARAAIAVSGRRYEDAELAAREIISYGVLISDHAHTLSESIMATFVVETGLKALEDVYIVTGRVTEAATLKASREGLNSRVEAARQPGSAAMSTPVDDASLRAQALRILLDRTRLRSERWEALHGLSLSTCTTARELVFGPDPELVAAFDVARAELGETALERQIIDQARTLDILAGRTDSLGSLVGILRIAGRLLGNPWMDRCPPAVQLVLGGT